MAQSPTHRLGQIIGDLLEESARPLLESVAQRHGVYLDFRHERPARNGRSTVSWVDSMGNSHRLDYVIEQGGSEDNMGRPRAFIETAWRRYTKHSRNKAQEIQGAVLALAETYRDCRPFLGVILAGVFTDGSLQQLRSNGFRIVYLPYEKVLEAFRVAGINAAFDEDTRDEVVQGKVDAYERLTQEQRAGVCEALRAAERGQLDAFVRDLCGVLGRAVETVYVTTLHGQTEQLRTPQDAIAFLKDYQEAAASLPFVRYELGVRFTNGDEVRATFRDKAQAIEFLRGMR